MCSHVQGFHSSSVSPTHAPLLVNSRLIDLHLEHSQPRLRDATNPISSTRT